MIKYFFYLYYNRWYEDGKGDIYKPWIPAMLGTAAVCGLYTLFATYLIFDMSKVSRVWMKLYLALLLIFYAWLAYQLFFKGNKANELYNSFGDSSKIKNYKKHQIVSIIVFFVVFLFPFAVYALLNAH